MSAVRSEALIDAKGAALLALVADAERWRRFNGGEFDLGDDEVVRTHINIGVNVWLDGKWVAFHECSPDEFDAAIADKLGVG